MGSCHYSHRFYLNHASDEKKDHHLSTIKLVNVMPNDDIMDNEKTTDYDNNKRESNNVDNIKIMKPSNKNTIVPEITHNNNVDNTINMKKENNIIIGHTLDKTGLQYREASHDINNFMLAIKRGDITTVSRLIEDGCDISCFGIFGTTPLITSCQYGYRDITEMILNHKCMNTTIINHCNEKKVSALLYACMNGDIFIVEKLISLGSKPFLDPSCPIHNPVTDSTIALTPLSIAIINGHLAIVKLFLDLREDINRVFDYPIGKSITNKNNGKSGPNKVTPLLLASFYGQLGVINEALSRNADWTLRDDESSSIVHHACRLSDTTGVSVLEILKTYKCNITDLINSFDSNGDTPLHIACDHKNIDTVSWLLANYTINVNIQNIKNGLTPLHIAIRRRNDQLVKILLSNNADPKIVDNKNSSSVDLISKLRTDNDIYILIYTHINEQMILEDL